jgi:hypothetical protein
MSALHDVETAGRGPPSTETSGCQPMRPTPIRVGALAWRAEPAGPVAEIVERCLQ